eukprot:CAMPEP_0176485090 /NCGR_PEP_ID=MMETSP0200_2-20121128/4857_1 /TAXON_ID=947934 /ORGANISM="Chaetoceros sp., Strain GSL56" /LENGTH=343 /DNA_ID=CAMNT_0017881717 /DNA_START=179 /DNA_END=1210 /DNA_ORIENTATION=-
MSNKRPAPPLLLINETAKRSTNTHGVVSRSNARNEDDTSTPPGPDPNDPTLYDCVPITSELLSQVNFPVRTHSPFLSVDWPRIIPAAAVTLLHAIHGQNDIRRARGEYFLACALGTALNTLHITRLDKPIVTLPPSTRDDPHQDTRLKPSHLLWRFFLANPFFLLHAFAADDTHQAVSTTALNILAPCPFCYCKMSSVRDYFRGTLACPRTHTDLEGQRRANEASLFRLHTNKALLLHCGTVELARHYSEADRTLFVAVHRLYAEMIEHIRATYCDDFLPWLDEPIAFNELSYLRDCLQDFHYEPDLLTKHPSADPRSSPEDPDMLTQDLAQGARLDDSPSSD